MCALVGLKTHTWIARLCPRRGTGDSEASVQQAHSTQVLVSKYSSPRKGARAALKNAEWRPGAAGAAEPGAPCRDGE